MTEPSRLIPFKTVRDRTTLSRTEIYRRIAAGQFPAPLPLGGGRRVAWLEESINAWIAARVAAGKGEASR